MNETWLPAIGLEEKYEVSSLGRVRSFKRQNPVRPSYRSKKNGYLTVTVSGRGRVNIHVLVAQAFLGQGPHRCHWCGEEGEWARQADDKSRPGLRVDHLDRNTANNAASNLVPACNRCNTRRNDQRNIMPGELVIKSSTTHGRVTRAEERSCEVCGAKFLHMIAKRDPAKGRFCSRSCAMVFRHR